MAVGCYEPKSFSWRFVDKDEKLKLGFMSFIGKGRMTNTSENVQTATRRARANLKRGDSDRNYSYFLTVTSLDSNRLQDARYV